MVLRAAAYTDGEVSALLPTAACAKDEKFLKWGGPPSLAFEGIGSIGEIFLSFTFYSLSFVHTVVNPHIRNNFFNFSSDAFF